MKVSEGNKGDEVIYVVGNETAAPGAALGSLHEDGRRLRFRAGDHGERDLLGVTIKDGAPNVGAEFAKLADPVVHNGDRGAGGGGGIGPTPV